jgi:hypothetical protein
MPVLSPLYDVELVRKVGCEVCFVSIGTDAIIYATARYTYRKMKSTVRIQIKVLISRIFPAATFTKV